MGTDELIIPVMRDPWYACKQTYCILHVGAPRDNDNDAASWGVGLNVRMIGAGPNIQVLNSMWFHQGIFWQQHHCKRTRWGYQLALAIVQCQEEFGMGQLSNPLADDGLSSHGCQVVATCPYKFCTSSSGPTINDFLTSVVNTQAVSISPSAIIFFAIPSVNKKPSKANAVGMEEFHPDKSYNARVLD
jgi:hypothetical protein